MSDAVIVFARLDSHRLPGKALTDIAGRLLIDRVIDRCLDADTGSPVLVATSDRPTDDPIADHVQARGIDVFRGDSADVAGRALACAETRRLDRFLRISGDSPFIEPDLISRCLKTSRGTGADLTTNVFPRTYPIGVSVEAVTAVAMRRITDATDDPDYREHVTKYSYDHPGDFTIENLTAPDGRYQGLRLAVDTPDDLARTRWIFDTHGDNVSLDCAADAARTWETKR